MRLVDSHGHVQSDRFDADRDAVLEQARAAGVERLLVPGWNLASSRGAIELAGRHPWLDPAVGIHPHDAARADASTWSEIVDLARDPRVVAVGETGLDFDRMFSPVDAQRANLRRHLELGHELGKPVIIHCRSAAGDATAHDAVLALLDEVGARDGGAVIHSFSGSLAFAEAVLARGLAISVSGLAFRSGEDATFASVAPIVPPDRLLTETDSPYLSPPGAPRRRNEPAWVRVTAERLAEARATPAEELGDDLVGAYDSIFGRAS